MNYNRFKHVPGYQLPLADAVKSLCLRRMRISSVGVLPDGTERQPSKIGLLAEQSLQEGKAVIISVGQGVLQNPE